TEVNENVAAGKAVIVLTSGKQPEVKITIPGVMIAQVKSGSSASVSFDAIQNRTFQATVTEVGVTATGFETTYPVIIRLDEETDAVRPGMAANVSFRFETSTARERILVPSVAVAEDRQGRYVFIVEPGEDDLGIARRKKVQIGELTEEGLEVLEGLQEGELLITAGVTRIVDGQKVRLL
ncbi:efflux RND transporter periplasmic adaptor subunit, partial [bacterium]|nr:efflux RND transporter periplasmic adaptor subunit [bacterium]